MQIKEVENLVGISKKNIRFYEKEGLLNPKRNDSNDYRDYSDDDVILLKKIKLLRKLDVPLAEIKQLKSGTKSFKELLISQHHFLTKEAKNNSIKADFCNELIAAADISNIDDIGIDRLLALLVEREQNGTAFTDIEHQDISKNMVGAVISAVTIGIFCIGWIIFSIYLAYTEDMPLIITICSVAITIAVIMLLSFGVFQRYKELKSGEEYEAKKY